MLFINKLTVPGGIRRIDLLPDTVKVSTTDGRVVVYCKTTSTESSDPQK